MKIIQEMHSWFHQNVPTITLIVGVLMLVLGNKGTLDKDIALIFGSILSLMGLSMINDPEQLKRELFGIKKHNLEDTR